ncbi:ATP-binding protein [Catenovulum sp. 2E275]|uniref:ATP-binding protein n=1 Tax=Catenovulum sp. 2E275 TaxID=2980497 RepID=UPI0021D397F6|nr:ATP-binding protein [Catenovulum sp. 2E275]MCU4677126.1 ATP-binding protein [Catenovulum sp. 2E275]
MFKPSILFNAIVYAIIPSILMTVGISTFIVHMTTKERNELIQEQSKTLIESIAYASEFNLVSLNKLGLQNKLRDIHTTSSLSIKNIIIYDDAAEVFAASNYQDIDYKFREFATNGVSIINKDSSNMVLLAPIYAFDNSFSQSSQWATSQSLQKPIGQVLLVVNLSTDSYQRFLTNFTLTLLIGLSALVSAILMLALVNRIVRPVQAFVDAVKRIGSGDLKYRLKIPVQYEFNDLKDGINVMAEQLQHHQAKLESEIEVATQDLQQNLLLVEEKNAELDIARKEALEASKIKSQFLATMSHEVRTPLNAIVGFTKELSKAKLPNPYQDYVTTINASADNLIAIVNDVLDFSKIEAGKIELDYSAFNLNQMIEDVIKLMSREAFSKGLEFSLESDILPIAAIGDQHRFKQIITNLLSNAIKFTPDGYIILRISITSISETQHQLNIDIEDSGIGISKEKQSKLFNAFHQADASTTRRYGGTGLGLAITHGLVQKMNGTISLKSELGRGSTFSLKLPITTSKPNRIEKPKHIEKVLVLDSKTITHRAYHRLFHPLGILADICQSTEQWEAKLHQSSDYDLIIIASENDEESLELLPLQAAFAAKQQVNCSIVLCLPLYACLGKNQQNLLGDWPVIEKPFTYKKLEQICLQKQEAEWYAQTNPVHQITADTANSSINILAVDDNETNLKLLTAILQDQKVQLTCCGSGENACIEAEKTSFDIILMDVQMPVMDGIQTTQKIRSGQLNKDTPIIAFTAHAFKEEREKLLKSGMDDYLAKPIDMKKFNRLVNKWVFSSSKRKLINQVEEISIKENSIKHGIDWELALSRAGNQHNIAVEMLHMLVDTFVDVKKEIQQIQATDNFQALLAAIHKFHGATCYSGVPYLNYLANNIELQLKKSVNINLDEQIEALFKEMDLVAELAKNYE